MSIGHQSAASFPRPGVGSEVRIVLLPTLLWLGVLIGVSFLATPAKFQAPSLDLPTALDVGRKTFALLSKVECGLLGVVAVTAVASRVRIGSWTLIGFLAIILMAQGFWLLPVLDERVALIIVGERPPPGIHHWLYVLAEGLKALVLILLSVVAWGRSPWGARN